MWPHPERVQPEIFQQVCNSFPSKLLHVNIVFVLVSTVNNKKKNLVTLFFHKNIARNVKLGSNSEDKNKARYF